MGGYGVGKRASPSWIRSWFPYAMQSRIWGKTLGGASYPLLAMLEGSQEHGGPVMREAPEEGHLLPALGSLEETGFLGRGLTDYSTK